MSQVIDPVTFSVPRKLLTEIVHLSDGLTDRMHQLLESNTDGRLSAAEQSELATLVQMAQFGQIISAALQPPGHP